MKLFLLTFLVCLCSLTISKAQETTTLDSLEATLENLSWKELDSIGNKLRGKRNYQESEIYLKKALQIAEEQNGKDSLYAISCRNLGFVYAYQGMYNTTEPLFKESKKVIGNILGKKHPQYAMNCNNLAILYASQGLFNQAEVLYLKTQYILEQTIGKEHPDYSIFCSNLASFYRLQSMYNKAEKLYLETKKLREKTLGTEHPDYTKSCNYLANLFLQRGRYQEAMPLYKKTIENNKKQIELLFPNLSENEKQEYFSSIAFYFSDFTDFATQYYSQNKRVSQDLFNQQLFTKGIIFSSTQKMKKQINSSKDSVLINQYENWRKQKTDYISLLQKPINERDSAIDVTQLTSQINELEREISKKSESFKSTTNQKEYTWLDVKQTLSKKEAAIEIIRLVKLNNQNKPKDTIYIALIVTSQTKKNPELLILENGSEMENGDFSFYQNNINFQLEDNESYNQYWKPIRDKLGSLSKRGYSKIYFSADGIYHKLNLNTLQNPKTGKYLVEEQNIQLITSSRDLIERKEKGVKNVDLSKNFESYKAYLLGYPSYNLNGKDTLNVNGENRSLNGLQRIIGEYAIVPVLEGTKKETNQINALFTKKGISTTLLQNNDATEENIKALKNPTILHFATHGFFINEITTGEPKTLQEAEDRSLIKNPFLRSGILLAGCQNPQTGEEDGILSAEEAMNLTFDRTELVVLSACETGLGDIHNGEGVYGLQRAFRQAGAKTIIMSLWKVSDEATQLLMVTFYENLLNGKSKREAFKIAQLKLKEKYNEPFYWGAFVMVGE